MRLPFSKFAGSIPRLEEHLLGEAQAAYALDCRFEHGSIDAWRELRTVHTAPAGTLTSIPYACCWLDFPTCVDWAYGPIGCPNHLFITGRVGYPERAVVDIETCSVAYSRLGLPCPESAPEVMYAEPTTTADKDSAGFSYAYQYVNAFDETSALSPASPVRMARDGTAQVVSGWTVPDPSWGVTKIRIYRAVSAVGASMAKLDPANTPDTTWMLVGEAAVGAAAFMASGWAETYTEALVEDIVVPPPADLRGITWVESQNTLAGYVGNRLYFSHNNDYHSWPYQLELDDNICAIAEVNNTLYVMTDGAPYVIEATKECKAAHLREVRRLPLEWPIVACGNRHVARLPQGVVYPSHNGLVMLSGNAVPSLLTNPLYAPEDWQLLQPHTVIPEVFGGKLFVFARGGSFVLGYDGNAEPGWNLDTHSELSDTDVVDAVLTRTGELMLLKQDGSVGQWNRGGSLRPYQWHSPLMRMQAPVGLAVTRLVERNGFTDLQVFCDEDLVFNETVYRTENNTLPMWAYGYDWQVRLRGTATVTYLCLATSMREL